MQRRVWALVALGVVLLLNSACGTGRSASPSAVAPPPPPTANGSVGVVPPDPAAPPAATEPAPLLAIPDPAPTDPAATDPAATEPAPLPPDPAPPDCQPPAPGLPWGKVQWTYGGWGGWAGGGTCRVPIDAGRVWIVFWLPPQVDEAAARAALSYATADEPTVTFSRRTDHALLEVRLSSGTPGTTETVTLAGPLGPGGLPVDIGFVLERQPLPRFAAEWRRPGEDWQPLPPGTTLPRQALELRFRGPDIPDLAWEIIRQLKVPTVNQPDAETVQATLSIPPARLSLQFQDVQTARGKLWGNGFVVYFGDPPQLVALDPAGGNEQVIAPVPPDLFASSLSPDGRWALLMTVAPDHLWRPQLWLVNTATGEQILTGFHFPFWPQPVLWQPGRVVIPYLYTVQTWHLDAERGEEQASAALRLWVPSPSGRYLAGFDQGHWRAGQSPVVPVTVVVYDLHTGTERTFPGAVQTRLKESDAPPTLGIAWTPDEQALLVEDLAGDPQAGGVAGRTVRLDLATGTVTPHDGSVPPAPPDPGSWLPGPDGWQVHRGDTWGEIRLRAPDGREQQWGQGHVLGWRADGRLLIVRWENAGERRPRMGL